VRLSSPPRHLVANRRALPCSRCGAGTSDELHVDPASASGITRPALGAPTPSPAYQPEFRVESTGQRAGSGGRPLSVTAPSLECRGQSLRHLARQTGIEAGETDGLPRHPPDHASRFATTPDGHGSLEFGLE